MKTLTIHVAEMNGTEHSLEGIEGWRAMEVIRDSGLPINAECGGACACATCHVYVDPVWLDRLVPPSDEEAEKLADDAFGVESNSRLSCQIILDGTLDGLRLHLAPGSEP